VPSYLLHIDEGGMPERSRIARATALVLSSVRAYASRVYIDAYSDFEDRMPEGVLQAQGTLRKMGEAQKHRNSWVNIHLDLITTPNGNCC